MKHTVIGVFDTNSEARAAERALIEGGFQRPDVAVHAIGADDGTTAGRDQYVSEGAHTSYSGAGLDAPTSPVPTEPLEAGLTSPMSRDAETPHGTGMPHDESAWARTERFFTDLFGHRHYPPERAHYREALRRGSVLVSVDVFADAQVDVARETMIRAGAIDLARRVEQWREGGYRGAGDGKDAAHETAEIPVPPKVDRLPTDRSHSPVDELGLTDPLSAYYKRERYDPAVDARKARAVHRYPRDDAEDNGWQRLKATVRHGWDRLTGHR